MPGHREYVVRLAQIRRPEEDGSFHGKMRKGELDTLPGHWDVIGPEGTKVSWETTSERQ